HAGREHRRRERHHLLVVEAVVFAGRGEAAAQPEHRVAADLQVQVGGAALDGNFEQIVDVQGGHIRLVYRPLAAPDAVPAGVCTNWSQPCVSGASPRTIWKNRCWIASVTGPRRPRPTLIRSTDRIGVTSTAVPTKNISSARYSDSRGRTCSRTSNPRSFAITITESRVMPHSTDEE